MENTQTIQPKSNINMVTEWRTLSEFPAYEISDTGEIRNKKTNRIIKPSTSRTGYKTATLSNNGCIKCIPVHRLVLETFNPISNMSDYTVNHKDFDNSNNNLSNLEWTTKSDYKYRINDLKAMNDLESVIVSAIHTALHQYYNKNRIEVR